MARKKAEPISECKAEIDYVKFGNALRESIKVKGYTQPVVAEAIGVSDSTMWAMIGGKRRITLDNYIKLIDVLDVNFAPLLQDNYIENIQIYSEFFALVSEKSPKEIKQLIEIMKSTENS